MKSWRAASTKRSADSRARLRAWATACSVALPSQAAWKTVFSILDRIIFLDRNPCWAYKLLDRAPWSEERILHGSELESQAFHSARFSSERVDLRGGGALER